MIRTSIHVRPLNTMPATTPCRGRRCCRCHSPVSRSSSPQPHAKVIVAIAAAPCQGRHCRRRRPYRGHRHHLKSWKRTTRRRRHPRNKVAITLTVPCHSFFGPHIFINKIVLHIFEQNIYVFCKTRK
jgi:hypothetical protein